MERYMTQDDYDASEEVINELTSIKTINLNSMNYQQLVALLLLMLCPILAKHIESKSSLEVHTEITQFIRNGILQYIFKGKVTVLYLV